MAKPVADDPVTFFNVQSSYFALQRAMEKYEYKHGRFGDGYQPLEMRLFGAARTLSSMRGEYERAHGRDQMTFLSAQHGTDENISYERLSYAAAWPLLWNSYLRSIMIAIVFLFLRLTHRHLNVWIEFWRVPFYSTIWPIGLFLYPVRIDPQKQLRQALQFAAYIFSAFVSFSSMGGVAKAEGKGGIKKSVESGYMIETDYGVELEMFPLTDDHKAAPWYLSPELWWRMKTRYGELSGFSFAEASEEESTFFTNHAINYTLPIKWLAPFSISHEAGGNIFTGPFSQLGGRVNVNKLPIIGDFTKRFFDNVGVGLYSKMAGARVPNEWLFVWATKKLPLGKGFSLSSSGFYRKRKSKFPDFAQPQLWLHHRKFPHMRFGTELQVLGGAVYPRFGLKYAF